MNRQFRRGRTEVKFTMTLKMDNAAFYQDDEHEWQPELVRILHKLAKHFEDGGADCGTLVDINGSRCGQFHAEGE